MTRAKLLVEGNDDQHVIWSLLKYYKVPEVFAVEEKKGIDNLLDVLPVQLKESGIERVGVVVDADAKISTRWQKIKKILREFGFRSLPKSPDVEGTVIEENGKPRVGVWIMPDNTLPGMLENFTQFLIPKDDKLMTYVENSLIAIAKDPCRITPWTRPPGPRWRPSRRFRPSTGFRYSLLTSTICAHALATLLLWYCMGQYRTSLDRLKRATSA